MSSPPLPCASINPARTRLSLVVGLQRANHPFRPGQIAEEDGVAVRRATVGDRHMVHIRVHPEREWYDAQVLVSTSDRETLERTPSVEIPSIHTNLTVSLRSFRVHSYCILSGIT